VLDASSQEADWTPGQARNSAILLTGAGGEVGHGLIDAIHEEGRRTLVALDIRRMGREQRGKCMDTFVGDICDSALLARMLSMYEIRAIFHLAALLSTRAEFNPEPAHDVNVGGTLGLLRLAAEQARSHGEKVKFIFPSSIAVFGMPDLQTKAEMGKVVEDLFLLPTTMYGCNKLYCENLGRYYQDHYRQLAKDRIQDIIDFRCVRYPGLISAETLPSGGTSDFAPEMIHAAAQGRPYSCFVRPDTRIPFMTMPDAIGATLQLAKAPKESLTRTVYNLSAFNPSAGELAEIVKQHFPGASITFEPDPERQGIVDTWPEDVDSSSATEDWGFAPQHDLESAFEDHLVPRIKMRYANK
jgi:nucleoside-diphosphate-sugar epimerase